MYHISDFACLISSVLMCNDYFGQQSTLDMQNRQIISHAKNPCAKLDTKTSRNVTVSATLAFILIMSLSVFIVCLFIHPSVCQLFWHLVPNKRQTVQIVHMCAFIMPLQSYAPGYPGCPSPTVSCSFLPTKLC